MVLITLSLLMGQPPQTTPHAPTSCNNITVTAASPQLGAPSCEIISGSSNGNITVTLTVSDTVGLSSVKLYYRIANTTTWNNKTMTKTGAVYNAMIGPNPFGTMVNYYVNATDTLGRFACTPDNAPTSYYNAPVGRIPSLPPPGYLSPTDKLIAIGGLIAFTGIIIANILLYTRSKKSTLRQYTQKAK
jgi:hypothetical protein